MSVVCDTCQREIPQPPIGALQMRVIATDEKGEPVEENFFKCPHCGRKYTFFVGDSKLRFMIANWRNFSKAERRAYELELRERYKAEIEEG